MPREVGEKMADERELADRRKVEAESIAKFEKERLEDYIVIALGVGAVFVVWLLGVVGAF